MGAMVSLPSLMVWSATATIIFSFTCAAFLCVRCALYLRRTRRRIGGQRELVKHIAAIAGADASMAAWSYMGSFVHSRSLLVHGDPAWCQLFTAVRMWLVLLSALWTASLALATVAVLLGKGWHARLLQCSTFGVVPVSLVLCAPTLWQPVYMETVYDGSVDCEQSVAAKAIECGEQASIQLFILAVLVYTQLRARGLEPTSIERRSMCTISRYFLAYTASYSLWIAARTPWPASEGPSSAAWGIFVSVAWRLLSLNGAFNFAALWLHARDEARGLRDPSLRARFLEESLVQTREVVKVDHGRLCKRNKAEVAQVQNANQHLWKELGLTYEQGVSGQLEPLSEEERASHFYSILDITGACRLQRATIT